MTLDDRPGASRPRRNVLSLIHALLLGADCIDGCDVLRAGRTDAILGHKPMAPSTLGSFLIAVADGDIAVMGSAQDPCTATAKEVKR